MKNQCLVIAGEKSGEEHFLSMWPELQHIQFWGVGGDDMQSKGIELLYHLKDFGSVGFSEVIGKLKFYKDAMNNILAEVEKRECKTALLVDFQGFNLRLAEKLTKRGVRVLYYVAPQAWIWKEQRVHKLKNFVHSLYTILPFEKKWFEERGVKQICPAPHPVFVESKNDLFSRSPLKSTPSQWKILLLPGSRKTEIRALLPTFICACELLRKNGFNIEVTVLKSASVDQCEYAACEEFIDRMVDNTHLNEEIKKAHFAMASSGTVTLSTGLLQLPTVVAYASSLFSEIVFRSVVRYNGAFSLTNILLKKFVYPELLQGKLNSNQLYIIIKRYLTDLNAYNQVINDLDALKEILDVSDLNVGLDIKNKIESCYEISG